MHCIDEIKQILIVNSFFDSLYCVNNHFCQLFFVSVWEELKFEKR
ncbi:MAG: hypothetical protein OFPI_26610 [Osedax symbiont Rs2]|nr:MAG: hypothetical protein OFPI_26610 [Osedax symbiont Rs2]